MGGFGKKRQGQPLSRLDSRMDSPAPDSQCPAERRVVSCGGGPCDVVAWFSNQQSGKLVWLESSREVDVPCWAGKSRACRLFVECFRRAVGGVTPDETPVWLVPPPLPATVISRGLLWTFAFSSRIDPSRPVRGEGSAYSGLLIRAGWLRNRPGRPRRRR